MTHIVHVITSLDTGGAEMMLAKLLRRMNRQHFSAEVVSLTTLGRIGTDLQQEGFAVTALGMSPGSLNLGGLFRLIQLLRNTRPSVVQTWLYHADLYGLMAASLAGVGKVIWNIRCSCFAPRDFSFSLRLIVRLLAWLSRMPAAIVVNSEAGRQVHEAVGYHPDRWEVIPNGFDHRLFRPDPEARHMIRQELGLDDECLLIGLIGRFDPFKDHDTFIRAASLLTARRKDVRFLLAGRGIDKSNHELVNKLALHGMEHCFLLGERNDIPAVTAALDIAVCSSYSEGFPNVIGEAMTCAVSCVVTDVGDCAIVVGDTGVLVPPRSPERLEEGIRYLLELRPSELKTLGIRARERILTQYNIEQIAWRYEQLYAEFS